MDCPTRRPRPTHAACVFACELPAHAAQLVRKPFSLDQHCISDLQTFCAAEFFFACFERSLDLQLVLPKAWRICTSSTFCIATSRAVCPILALPGRKVERAQSINARLQTCPSAGLETSVLSCGAVMWRCALSSLRTGSGDHCLLTSVRMLLCRKPFSER